MEKIWEKSICIYCMYVYTVYIRFVVVVFFCNRKDIMDVTHKEMSSLLCEHMVLNPHLFNESFKQACQNGCHPKHF